MGCFKLGFLCLLPCSQGVPVPCPLGAYSDGPLGYSWSGPVNSLSSTLRRAAAQGGSLDQQTAAAALWRISARPRTSDSMLDLRSMKLLRCCCGDHVQRTGCAHVLHRLGKMSQHQVCSESKITLCCRRHGALVFDRLCTLPRAIGFQVPISFPFFFGLRFHIG